MGVASVVVDPCPSNLSPNPLAAAAADPGSPKPAAREARGVRTLAVTSAPAATPIGRPDTTASPASTGHMLNDDYVDRRCEEAFYDGVGHA
jgi:hypothetical protein